jgi:hypothetical protein
MADWQVVQVHRGAPPKPELGKVCNGCGVCCLAEPCPLGVLVSRRRHGACDALRWDAQLSLYRCGMVSDPGAVMGPRWRFLAPLLQRLARRWISAGTGCDSSLQIEAVPDDSPPR